MTGGTWGYGVRPVKKKGSKDKLVAGEKGKQTGGKILRHGFCKKSKGGGKKNKKKRTLGGKKTNKGR